MGNDAKRGACTIGPASLADVPGLAGLLCELFRIEQDFKPRPERQVAGLQLLLADPAHAAVFAARDHGGTVVGMVTAQLVISTAEGAPSAWIEDLVIAKPHRRRGLGRRLLAAVLEWAGTHGATRAQLLFDVDNQPAVDFYDRLGWEGTHLAARRVFLKRP